MLQCASLDQKEKVSSCVLCFFFSTEVGKHTVVLGRFPLTSGKP